MARQLAAKGGLSLVLALAAAAPGPVARGQSSGAGVELVSQGTDGMSGNHHSGSDGLIPARGRISADGRYVVFESYASTLVCTDDDFSTRDIFVRDRLAGRAVVASVAWDGGEANHNSFDPVISADGRYVAFASQATNLVPGDTNGFNDIFVRDLQAGTTTRVSVSSSGEQANSVSHGPALSGDGRSVTFYSGASNLVPGDTNGRWDTFVHDVVAGTTERLSVSSAGVESPCCDGVNPSISADGRYVAFLFQGSLDPSVPNHWQEIYIRDRAAGTTTLVRPTAAGGLSSGGIRFADISANGRFVAFQSSSDNIVVPDQNGFTHDIFLKDLVTGTTILVSQSTDGAWGNRDSWMPSVSADGRYVAFHSWANNLVPGDTNTHPFYDVFVRDTVLGTTTRVNVTPSGGEADGSSTTASISADGSLVLFESTATNLAPNDLVNGFPDVFLAGPAYPESGDGASFQFAAASIEAPESAGVATVAVTRQGPFCSPASVQYATTDGTATAGVDYAAASGTLTFAAGEGSRTFDVPLLDDGVADPGETIQLTLSNPAGGPALGHPSTATLTILEDDTPVNRAPHAVDDVAVMPEDVPAAIPVRANDSDPDGDPLTVTAFTQGAHGAVADDGTGLLVYTPLLNFAGADTFAYTVSDGNGASDTASVHVMVTPVNDLPVAAADQYTTPQGTVLTVAAANGVLANDTDPDGDGLTAALVAAPTQGALALAADGSFTFAPPEGVSGPVTFTYQAMDAQVAASAPTTVTVIVQPGEIRTSTCRPVTPAAVHRVPMTGVDFLGEPFRGNRRLALIEDGTVPCVEVDTMEATRCAFWTPETMTSRTVRASGPWMEDAEGRSYAVVGHPVTRDGSLSGGAYIVAATPEADGTVTCVASTGRDAVGASASYLMADTCILETAGAEWNASGRPLINDVTRYVGTTSVPHPDGAQLVSFDPVAGVGWYTGPGAALNDTGGVERDQYGVDALGHPLSGAWPCHFIELMGVQVPAAKRPSTRSFPAPGRVNVNSRIRWLAVNPYVDIANDSPFDPRLGPRPTARFTHAVQGETLSLDGSSSEGQILLYEWDLEWTARSPDLVSGSPTVEIALGSEAVPPFGYVTLNVISRDRQGDTARQRVVIRQPPVARFTHSLSANTLWVDGTPSQGEVLLWSWDLSWTAASPDAIGPSPTAEFPLAFPGIPPRSGIVTLTVIARDGQMDTIRDRVVFRPWNPFPRGAGADPPAN
jgi:Tol biopolymer transport system component